MVPVNASNPAKLFNLLIIHLRELVVVRHEVARRPYQWHGVADRNGLVASLPATDESKTETETAAAEELQ